MLHKSFILLFIGTLMLLTFTGCPGKEDDVAPTFRVPDDYTFTRDGQSTVAFSGQSTRIAMAEELVAALLDFDKTEQELMNMFTNAEGTNPFSDPDLNASDKSIRSKVAASADLFSSNATAAAAIKADFDGWISAQVNEVFPNRNEVAFIGQAGQMADGDNVRYVNDWGLEYNQAFAKALIGGLMYDQVVNNYLSSAVLDAGTNRVDNDLGVTEDGQPYTTMEHKWDEAFGYLFGAAASPATPLDDLGDADNFLNKYVGRVEDDPDFAGIAGNLESSYRLGRSAIVVGEYGERDARAFSISGLLRDVIAIRSIYYLKQAEAGIIANSGPTGGVFHDLSEAYGFIYSLRFINLEVDGQRLDLTTFSDLILTELRNVDDNGFWGLETEQLAKLADDIAGLFLIDVNQAAN